MTKTVADILVQMGRPRKEEGRHLNMPNELGSTMVFDTLAAFEAARHAPYVTGTAYYGRSGNAAFFKLESLLPELEQAGGITLTSSGVAAISPALLTFARPGGHVLVADHVYANTRAFSENVLGPMDMTLTYFDPMFGAGVAELITDKTFAVMFEAPGSGTFEIPDIPAIAAAKVKGVPSIVDSTWATPLF